MARRKTRTLTELELEIMQVVWDRGEAAVEDVRAAHEEAGGKPLALPSVRTMLSILIEKGYLERKADGRRHIYYAKVSREQARRSILRDLIERAFDGSALEMVASLLNTRLVSEKDAEEVRRLIEEAERHGAKEPKGAGERKGGGS